MQGWISFLFSLTPILYDCGPCWDVRVSYSWNSNGWASKSLIQVERFTTWPTCHARWQQKPQFSSPPPHHLGCWWCQCRTWVWLGWWQWIGHRHSMESSAFVSSSCWTLTAMASAALQAGPWSPYFKILDVDQWVSGIVLSFVLTWNCRSHTAIPPFFLMLQKSRTFWCGLSTSFWDTPIHQWYMMIRLDTPWYPHL